MNQKIIVKVSEIKIGDFLTIFGHRFTVASIEPAKRFGEIVLWNAPIRGNIPAPYLKLAASAEVAVERVTIVTRPPVCSAASECLTCEACGLPRVSCPRVPCHKRHLWSETPYD